MFTRFAEDNVRPTLLSQGEIYLCRRDVDELIAMIQRQVVMRLAFEFSQHLFIAALNPTCCCYVYRFELALDLVFITQAMRDYIKLQRPDGTQNQVVIAHGLE